MLYTSQNVIIEDIKNNLIRDSARIVVKGRLGSGKSTAINELLESEPFSNINVLVFNRSEDNDDDYAPFEKATRKSKSNFEGALEKLFSENKDKDYSVVQSIISASEYIKDIKTQKNEYPFFKESEEQFLSQINSSLYRRIGIAFLKKYKTQEKKLFFKKNFYRKDFKTFIQNQNSILFFEEINTWDYNSLMLIKKILEHGDKTFPLIEKAKIIFTFSDNIVLDKKKKELIQIIFRKSNAEIVKMPALLDEDFVRMLEQCKKEGIHFIPSEQNEVINFLKEYSKDNIEEAPYLITEIYKIMDDKSLLLDEGSTFYTVLKEKLESVNISSSKSEELLEYASLIGNTFSKKEMVLVSELSSDALQLILNKVIDIRVLKEAKSDYEENYKFASIFFQELFKSKAIIRNDEYYTKLEQIVNNLYPYKYLRRANYLSNVFGQHQKTQQLYFLSLLSQLRNKQELDLEIIEKITSENLDFLDLFKKVYSYFNHNNYQSALKILEIIKGKSGDITKIAEADILMAMCYSKSISPKKRLTSISLLETYQNNNDLKIVFTDIYERLLMRLFVMKVHINQLSEARTLYQYLLERLDTYDSDNIDVQIKKHTLFRVANTIFNEHTSLYMITNAKNFFEGHQSHTNGMLNFYLSLCNLSAIQIENGDFSTSFKTAKQAEKIIFEHATITFPRTHILLNNYLLSGYLSNQLTAIECKDGLEKIIETMPENAERLFFISNLSIFYALTNDFDSAYQLLHDESNIQDSNNDIEGKYKSRVSYNLSIYNFLNDKKDRGIEQMENYIQKLLMSKNLEEEQEVQRANKALTIMKDQIEYCTGEEWLEKILKNSKVTSTQENEINSSPDNYRKLGFMFTAVYNWDV